jgi:polyphosphate kinase 2
MEKINVLSKEDFLSSKTNKDLLQKLKIKNLKKFNQITNELQYEMDLKSLQVELVKLQQWVQKTNKRVAIIFEGRDAAGKGGSIRRFIEHLNPRSMRLVALSKPTEVEQGQWYFRRYIKQLPNSGEIVFFDRSWYNRAVVEPVMGFCTENQYQRYMVQVPEFEHMLYESGVEIIKFWFSISKEEQQARFDSRLQNPLKRWKFSPVDQKGQELWDKYSFYKEQMFSKTHTSYCPWIIVKTNNKLEARLESIRYVLSKFDYDNKQEAETNVLPDPNVIMRYYRSTKQFEI